MKASSTISAKDKLASQNMPMSLLIAEGKAMPRYAAVISLIFLLSSCGPATPLAELSAEEKSRIVQEVDATVREYLSAIQSLDTNRMLSFWADVEGFAIATDGALLGYRSWADQIRTLVETTSEVTHIERSNAQVYVLARDAASYSMEFEWSMTSLEGVTTNTTGSWIYVFKRFPGGWRVVHSGGTHIYH